jgi:hypothetical protein
LARSSPSSFSSVSSSRRIVMIPFDPSECRACIDAWQVEGDSKAREHGATSGEMP